MIIRKANFSLLLFLFMIGNFLLFITAIHSSAIEVFFFHWTVLLVSVILILFLSPKSSYVVISILTVLYGLLFCYFSYTQMLFDQMQLIAIYGSYVLSVMPLLFIKHSFFSMGIRLNELLEETTLLKKYMDPAGKMLTKQEFHERSKIALRGMRRRNETGFLLEVYATNKGVTHKAWQNLIQNVVEETIRSDFDFYMNNEGTFILFLQNTNEDGVLTFQKRLLTNLRHHSNVLQPQIQFHYRPISEFAEADQFLLEEERHV